VAKDKRSVYEPGKCRGKWQKFNSTWEILLIGGYITNGKGGVESGLLGKAELELRANP
jgi:hypothetical protein